jgi:hypothetical protein
VGERREEVLKEVEMRYRSQQREELVEVQKRVDFFFVILCLSCEGDGRR